MGFYADHLEPMIVDFACGMKAVSRERAAVVPKASGDVLEIGFGSARNAPFYDAGAIRRLYALEPSPAMRRRAARRVAGLSFPVEWLELPGEEIPLDAASVDTVLVTFTLCTIPDVARALAGMRRVLKPGGRLIFLEHGRAPDPGVAKWQDQLNGVWGRIAGGCHLNRDPAQLIEKAGFSIKTLERHYAWGAPKFAGFMSAGVALP
ncbi:MAG: methyltransferase domain-containing protein [Pseudomonadota bacterium]|nr:methyltransferase domain-containing protein [Pseudomonadota bacterium]